MDPTSPSHCTLHLSSRRSLHFSTRFPIKAKATRKGINHQDPTLQQYRRQAEVSPYKPPQHPIHLHSPLPQADLLINVPAPLAFLHLEDQRPSLRLKGTAKCSNLKLALNKNTRQRRILHLRNLGSKTAFQHTELH